MHRKNPERREDLCDACHLMYERGLAHAAGGNASIRIDDEILITPTGIGLDRVQPDDLVHVGIGGQVLSSRQPSKELDLHLELYRTRTAAHAVLHPHPPHAIAWTARYPEPRLDAIPATNAGFYIRAGQIPQLPYLRSGSHQLRARSEEHTSELQSRQYLVCRLLLGNKGIAPR